MSQLSQTLFAAAENIRLSSPTESAVEHLKQAGFSEEDARLSVAQHVMEKEAAFALTEAGVDIEQAVSMVKAAGIHLKDLVTYAPEVEEAHPSVELLKQAAHYIDALEAQVEGLKEDLEKSAEENSVSSVALPESFTKAANAGAFTKQDLEELQRMDQGVLTKIASAMEEPWALGSGSGVARVKSDPMLDWLTS